MKYTPTVNDESLKNGLKVSAGLHVCLFVFLYVGLPHIIPPLPAHRESVSFDIVTIAEITNTRVAETPEEPKPSPPPAPPKPPAPAPAPEPVPQPQPKPQPPAPPAPKLEDIVEGLKPKPTEKPKPPPEKPPAPQQDLLGSVLKDVAKLKPPPQARGTDDKADPQTQSRATGLAPALSSRLTISEEDALRRQIEQCWNPPVGARDAEKLIVEVVIDVNIDRTVANAEIVDKRRYASDPFFRAAADAAVRAVYSPKCSPLELSPDKYEQWKRINFTFDPRDML